MLRFEPVSARALSYNLTISSSLLAKVGKVFLLMPLIAARTSITVSWIIDMNEPLSSGTSPAKISD